MNYLEPETCRQLKEWGCCIKSKEYWYPTRETADGCRPTIGVTKWKESGYLLSCDEAEYPSVREDCSGKRDYYPTYSLQDIICSGELAKKFFVEDWDCYVVKVLHDLIYSNQKEEAEKRVLEYCIFNPKNKQQ